MSEIYATIVRPLLTERSTVIKENNNQYVFEVALSADKRQIARAVSELFKVNVEKVRTMIVPGKVRRFGRTEGLRSDWKKAIVTVRKGQKIDVAEQA